MTGTSALKVLCLLLAIEYLAVPAFRLNHFSGLSITYQVPTNASFSEMILSRTYFFISFMLNDDVTKVCIGHIYEAGRITLPDLINEYQKQL